MPIDYAQLMQDRRKKADQARRPVRYPICLDLELYDQLAAAEERQRNAVVATIGEDDRAGGPLNAAVTDADREVAEIEQLIAEASVVIVCRVPTPARQAQLHDQLARAQKERPDETNTVVLESATATITETFERYETLDREPIAALNRQHLVEDLPSWPEGMIIDLANKIQNASLGVPDAPKSVRS